MKILKISMLLMSVVVFILGYMVVNNFLAEYDLLITTLFFISMAVLIMLCFLNILDKRFLKEVKVINSLRVIDDSTKKKLLTSIILNNSGMNINEKNYKDLLNYFGSEISDESFEETNPNILLNKINKNKNNSTINQDDSNENINKKSFFKKKNKENDFTDNSKDDLKEESYSSEELLNDLESNENSEEKKDKDL